MLKIFYRACAVENDKPRPVFYSKAVSLVSCLEAFKQIPGASFTIIHDGPVPQQVQILAEPYANIIELPQVGVMQSFIFTLQEATKGSPEDIVYLVEDDYLHQPNALLKLLECHRHIPCDYITLFDDPLRYKLSPDVPPDLPLIHDALYVSTSHHWRTIESTTLTFAGLARNLADDLPVFHTHLLRRAENQHYVADRESWRELQGLGEYAHREQKRTLVSAIPALATHCETTALSPTIAWEKVAADATMYLP